MSFLIKKRTKYLFFLGSIFLMAAVVCTLIFYEDHEKDPEVHTQMHTNSSTSSFSNEAISPHFEAKDNKGQPYVIHGKKAHLLDGNDSVIVLYQPQFTMTLETSKKISVTAEMGWLDQDTKSLKLKGRVHVEYGEDTVFNMPSVDVDLKIGSLFGTETLSGHVDKLNIHAGHFDIQERGAKIILTDHPVLRFHANS